MACAVVFAAADLDVAGAPVRRWGFAAFATVDAPEALFFVSFVVGEVEVTAVFTVAFAAAFLAAFVVVVSASPRRDPARRRDPEGAASFADDWELALLGAARRRAAALRAADVAPRTALAERATDLFGTSPVRPPFTAGVARFFGGVERLTALLSPCATRAVGCDFRTALEAPPVVAGAMPDLLSVSSPAARAARRRKSR